MIAAKPAASSVSKIVISKLAVVISKRLIPVLGKRLAKPSERFSYFLQSER